MTTGPCGDLRPRLPRLRRRADEPLAATARDLERRDEDLARARTGRRSEVRILAAHRPRARAHRRARRDLGLPLAGGGAAEDFELPSYADYYDWAIVPLGLFAAVVAPLLLCPDRRDGVLSLYAARPITPTDYVGSRWAAFLTVSRRSQPGFPWRSCSPGTRSTRRAPARGSADNWDVVPRLAGRRGRGRRPADDALAPRGVLRQAAGIRSRGDARRALRRLGDRRHRGGELRRARSPTSVSLAGLPQVSLDTVHWIFDDEVATRPRRGLGVRPLAGRRDDRAGRAGSCSGPGSWCASERERGAADDRRRLGVALVRRRRRRERRLARGRAGSHRACSGRTAPARRLCCARSPASPRRRRGRCASSASRCAGTRVFTGASGT